MSPKSRGRPKGRGRQPARRTHDAPRRVASAIDRLRDEALDATLDLPDGQLGQLSAQIVAAACLGPTRAALGLAERDPGGALVRAVAAATHGRRSREAHRALHILATVPEDSWRDEIAAALAGCPADQVPPWAVDPTDIEPEVPITARTWSDPWDEQRIYLLGYDDPIPHSVRVGENRVAGRLITSVDVGERVDDLEDSRGWRSRPTTVDEALADIADALAMTQLYWPPVDEPSYVDLGALVRWRTRGRARTKDWKTIPDGERSELLESFVAANAGSGDESEQGTYRVLGDTFLQFGEGYLTEVLAWGPGAVETFMLDWVHRKVLLEPEVNDALPEVLRAWVRFVLARRGCPKADVAPVLRAVRECEDGYRERLGDAGGPAKQVLSRLLADGTDLHDRGAVQAALASYNAEQLARRAPGISHGEP